MTTPENAALLLSRKEQFFKELLIPTGQFIEIVYLACKFENRHAHYIARRQANLAKQYAPIWDTLGLVSRFVMLPSTNATTLEQIAVSVTNMQGMLITLLKLLNTKDIQALLQKKDMPARYPERCRSFYTEALNVAELLKAIAFNRLYERMGFSDKNRQTWMLKTSAPANGGNVPLQVFKSIKSVGTTNKWRTFVRNLSWDAVNRQIITPTRPTDYTPYYPEAFTTPEGTKRAKALWTTVFTSPVPALGVLSTQLSTDELSANTLADTATTTEQAAMPDDIVPRYITIKSQKDGSLVLTATFDILAVMTEAQRTKYILMREDGSNIPVATFFQARVYQRVSTLTQLLSEVKSATAWYHAQLPESATIDETLSALEQALERRKVKEKVLRYFKSAEALQAVAAVLQEMNIIAK